MEKRSMEGTNGRSRLVERGCGDASDWSSRAVGGAEALTTIDMIVGCSRPGTFVNFCLFALFREDMNTNACRWRVLDPGIPIRWDFPEQVY